MNPLQRWRWIGCFSALFSSTMGIVTAIVEWNGNGPLWIIVLSLIVAMVALIGAIYQYNQARLG